MLQQVDTLNVKINQIINDRKWVKIKRIDLETWREPYAKPHHVKICFKDGESWRDVWWVPQRESKHSIAIAPKINDSAKRARW